MSTKNTMFTVRKLAFCALALALESGDSSQATIFEPLPDDQTEDETAGQSGKNSGQNDAPRHSWGSA